MPSIKSISKRLKNTLSGTMKEKIFFLHVPKCAGSSINEALLYRYLSLDLRKDRHYVFLDAVASANVIKMTKHSNYPHDESSDFPILNFRENILLYSMGKKNINYISGHFAFSDLAYEKFSNKFAFVTLIRDPVKRWISTYFYNRYKSSEHFKIDLDIEEYIESVFGKSQGCEYVKFLGGPRSSGNYSSEEAIERTKKNLHKFALIGTVEHLEDFKGRFSERFKSELNIDVKNRNPKPESIQKSVINSTLEQRIKEICRPDYEIYQYVVENFVSGKK